MRDRLAAVAGKDGLLPTDRKSARECSLMLLLTPSAMRRLNPAACCLCLAAAAIPDAELLAQYSEEVAAVRSGAHTPLQWSMSFGYFAATEFVCCAQLFEFYAMSSRPKEVKEGKDAVKNISADEIVTLSKDFRLPLVIAVCVFCCLLRSRHSRQSLGLDRARQRA